MADDLSGMAAQFTGGDVRPRDAGSGVGNMLTNSFFPGATPGEGSGATSAMSFGSGGSSEGAGSSYLAASQKLAQAATAAAMAEMILEKGILANRINSGEGGAGATAGNYARLAVINQTLGVASDDLYGNGKK